MNLDNNILNQLEENIKAQQALMAETLKMIDTFKKIPISPHPSRKEPFIDNTDAYHFSIFSLYFRERTFFEFSCLFVDIDGKDLQ